MKSRRFQLTVAAFLALLITAFYIYLGARTPIPRERKLADCTSPELRFILHCPGHAPYALLLAYPKDHGTSPSFRGHVHIAERGITITEFPFSSDTADACGWLEHSQQLTASILSWTPDDRLHNL